MSDLIDCDRHGGKSASCAVCCHVASSPTSGPVDGFEYFIDETGNWQAMCRACGDTLVELKDEARDAFVQSTLVVICADCFREAAAVNGVDVS